MHGHLSLALFTVGCTVAPCAAQYLHFASPTDTVNLPTCNTGVLATITIEARVLACGVHPPGVIFDEQFHAIEDKALWGGSQVGGAAWNTAYPYGFSVAHGTCPGVWHHLAYVYDGQQERFYIDGIGVSAGPRTGPTGESNASRMALGGFQPSVDSFRAGFEGYVDYIRVSSVARYVGPAFLPPVGSFAVDASTLLLFQFDEPAGSLQVTDAASGCVGMLGTGYPSATSPTLTGVVPCAGTPAANSMALGAGCLLGGSMTSLAASPAKLGSGAAFVMGGPPHGIAALFLAPALAIPVPLGGGCLVWIDPSSLILVTAAVLGGNGRASYGLPLPCDPSLAGIVARTQAVEFFGPALATSNPVDIAVGF